MADRAWAEIAIGGRADYTTLARLLEAEGHDLGEALETTGARHGGEGAYMQDGRLIVNDAEKIGGMFEELEAGLAEAGIAFDRLGGAHYEWPNSIAHFRPGWEEPRDYVSDSSHSDRYVGVGELQKTLRALREAYDAFLEDGRASLMNPVRDVLATWDRLAPEIPELPPLELVDETVEL